METEDEVWLHGKVDFSEIPSKEEETNKARRVARALHQKYEKEVERWKNYETLFGYIAFAILFLTVLYLQSNAHTAYQIHSSIQSIVPKTNTMTSSAAVLKWIQSTLKSIWKDPVCGDGVCETPFEFASYGRFGCRADCGKLPEVQTLTTLQIDLYYNFRHPANSISSAELMSRASWNLCPKNGAPHGKDCYYTADQTFSNLEGELHITLDDIPDGEWEVRIKRDFFNKIRGAVRVLNLLKEQASWHRKYGAYLAAVADQDFEINLLQEAQQVGQTTAYVYTIQEMEANFTAEYETLISNLEDDVISQATFDSENETLHSARDFLVEQYCRATCLCLAADFEVSCQDQTEPVVSFDAESGDDGPLSEDDLCTKYEQLTARSIALRVSAVREKLTTERSGGSAGYPGKIGTRAAKKTEQKAFINLEEPELFDWIFTRPVGTTPESDVNLTETKYDVLAKYFSDGPTAYLDPSVLVAQVQFTNAFIQSANLSTLLDLAERRIAEIQAQKLDTLDLPQINELVVLYSNATTGDSMEEILPNFIEYNQVTWSGGEDAYLTCNLEIRGPEYIGECKPSIECSRPNNTVPYECSPSSDLSAEVCNERCSAQEDCSALCECEQTCSSSEYCECQTCIALQDALSTTEYQSIQDLAAGSGNPLARKYLRRQLKQEDDAETITQHLLDLSESVNALRESQTDLETQVTSLETEVTAANALAEQRAEDNSLGQLINQGRAEIVVGQETVEGLLEDIIGKQNETLEAVKEATETVAALEEMTEKSVEAQAAIQVALREQMNAIKVAYQQNLITLDQAAELWKLARRDRLVSEKNMHLSTYRCSPEMVTAYNFEVNNYQELEDTTSRKRYIGLTNRVVAGMLVHATRTLPSKCAESRFKDLEDECSGGISHGSYGVDPVFKSGTALYNADLDNEESLIQLYNCSALVAPSYNMVNPYSTSEEYVNEFPFCTELFNMRNIPYGFRSFPLEGKTQGFPVWFDINLSEYEAELWYQFVEEGLFVDSNTRSVTVEMVVHNAKLNMFGYVLVTFDFTSAGSITVLNQVYTAKVELYETSLDFFRLTLEIILTGIVCFWLMQNTWKLFQSVREREKFLQHFGSLWSWINTGLSVLLFMSLVLWWDHVVGRATPFKIDINYDVYSSLNPPAAFLRLANNGDGLKEVNGSFEAMRVLVSGLSWYYALNGLITLVLIAVMLKKMDFQPRLGVVTRSIALAGSDLLHFFVVSGLVFFGYAMMAHLIFGSSLLAFSTFGRSVNTCFEILLGDISIAAQLKQLSGLQSFTGTLFFWSFEILVFLVLLNFLLAIIVDAFSEVKGSTAETTGVSTELFHMLQMKWKNFIGWLRDQNYVPYDQLGAVLKHYSTLEREHEPTPVTHPSRKLTVHGEEIDSIVLKEILRRSFAEASTVKEILPRTSMFGKSLSNATPSDAELNQIVDYLMKKLLVVDESPTEQEEAMHSEETHRQHLLQMMSQVEHVMQEEKDRLTEALDRLANIQEDLVDAHRQLLHGEQYSEQNARL